ncbi:hypothetical protein HaLaN_10962 [Haematococcus lacustris]|uniref:Uncharacterized protein n=1 Tax=Haematococcus lacustris TaxID=44745 RepID=A0A699Z6S1_HAELA|nr:hypothetical protein HaLaN_10962 [Haematococcus lacustris]
MLYYLASMPGHEGGVDTLPVRHLAESLGCPILGDTRYRSTTRRQFTHPVTQQQVVLEVPEPPYFLQLKAVEAGQQLGEAGEAGRGGEGWAAAGEVMKVGQQQGEGGGAAIAFMS